MIDNEQIHAKKVTVIITTYNRPHDVLRMTIPTYFKNECIGEMIIVDDASPINPADVITTLQGQYPTIKYIRKMQNEKLPAARNTGIKHAKFPYIHFGDDDNIIMPNAIDQALETMDAYSADIVAIRPLLADCMSDIDDLENFIRKSNQVKSTLIDLKRQKFNFNINTGAIIEVPVCNSAFLIKSKYARQVLFDESIKGNAYREETDFLIRAKARGAKIVFNPFIVTVNLPRKIATGGCHSGPKYMWYVWAIRNNWYFLKKNKQILRTTYGIKTNTYILQFYCIWDFFTRFCKNFIYDSK